MTAGFPGSAPTNLRRSLLAPSERDGDAIGEPRRPKLFGRRKGPKLSARQAALVETLLPRLKIQLRKHADPKSYFDTHIDEVWLEIGFGAGEHLLWQARRNPKIGIIGAEPYESGVGKLLSGLHTFSASSFPSPAKQSMAGEVASGARRCEPEVAVNTTGAPPPSPPSSTSTPSPHAGCSREREQDSASCNPALQQDGSDLLSRIRLYTGDAREIIQVLPAESLGRVFLLFPDPWPKKRHHKRRFVQKETLNTLARVMKPGAEFRLASDDPGYLAWMLECVTAHPAFAWTAQRSRDWLCRPDDWPVTRYEQKALHGPPVFLRFKRAA